MVKKVVIIGPESTGKSTLCSDLAEHYKTIWCPEYARQYLTEHGMDYSFEDLLTIAKGQIALEESTPSLFSDSPIHRLSDHTPYFIDTDLYVMKVWCEFVFGKCHQWILDGIAERQYDLYLLCATDLPWVKDELREYPDLESRERLYHIYKDILINQHTPWADIHGDRQERLQIGIKAVDKLLNRA